MSTFSGSINSNAYILAYSTADPNVFTVPPAEVSDTILDVSDTAFDLDLKHTCNHVLASGRYTLTTCPRCLGRGYYYDLKFNELGLVETTTKVEKLRQELEKATLTEVNPFHVGYGAALLTRLGIVSIHSLKIIIRNDLIATVNFLKEAQTKEAAHVPFSVDELISKIERIVVKETGPTTLTYLVEILTVSRENISLSGIITV